MTKASREAVRAGAGVPDVDALVQRVQAGVADKLRRGVYTREDLEQMRSLEGRLREQADAGRASAADIARLHAAWDPLGPHTFTSHRPGFGRLLVAAKGGLRRLVRPVAAVTLVRQTLFNGADARLLSAAACSVRSLESADEALARRLDQVDQRTLLLQARCNELLAEISSMRASSGRGADQATPQ